MWKDPDPDPGGDTQKGTSGQSTQELSDLKDKNEQQDLLLPQLKEMLRKEQSNVTEEKIKEYINTLSKVKAKKTKIRKDESGRIESSVSSSSIDVNKKGKLNLLKQQLEENKARLAERGKNQRGIEEMVTQLKAQLNDSQQLIPQNLTPPELKNLEYSRNSTQEELYNILLSREKRITELLNKSQTQEASILDLRENLKEKDSVIDARTKAVTLMTDSLSKKGKTTLDALDDTKEQMRRMQENFVTLESEMKARQVKLLNDLKAKNFEIAELQEDIHKLQEDKQEHSRIIDEFKAGRVEGESNKLEDSVKELEQMKAQNAEHVLKISELENQLRESLEDVNRLKSIGLSVSTTESNNSEVAKLKKQLDDSNKSMIKIKAQSKSKIKELTRKIDAFKKISDANAFIVKLQAENTKLGEKIAELEEEKGNMQLKMVESTDSVKDSTQLERNKELENKLAQNMEDIEEKDKIISLLESDIISLKAEIKSLYEQVSSFSRLENEQVTSEIKSIQIEEQMDEIENENLKLKKEIEDILKEKEGMEEKIEELTREKQEISSKLDNYIQENMELIDKLEKLSAEKVSSAESIEIVEGLTQQEKLELAAYQKNFHIDEEPIKCSEDDVIEPPAELNESVLQLSEDSTELLQKIDMFNMERKEVMGKMEALKEENNQLNMKLREIENNRDILAETYEQLQTEKEELQNENNELAKRLHKLEEENHEERVSYNQNVLSDAAAKLQELQKDYERLLAENEELKRSLKGYDAEIHEKHNSDAELSRAKQKIEDLETKIKTNLEELTNYETVIEENKSELINSASLINELQEKLNDREIDIADLQAIINDLNQVVSDLQKENVRLGNFELGVESQVSEMKDALQDQIQKAEDYEEEMARSSDIINSLNTKLLEMNKKIIETEHEMEMKDIESRKLAQDLYNKEETIKSLQTQIQEKDKKISYVVEDMKGKYLALQKQLDGNSGSLESKVAELTNKNKEQLEKMKKIAANLKKKTQAYQELEEQYKGEKEKWETELNEKNSVVADSKSKIDEILQQLRKLEQELSVKTRKLVEAENKERELTGVIHSLEQSKIELQNSIMELRHKEEKLNEMSLKQELSTSLHEEFDNAPSNQDSANGEKIKELELIIETNEADIAHYNDRVNKLEEDIARLEEEKNALERKAMELNEQLSVAARSVEEKTLLEEELGQKLAEVSASDEALIKKLQEIAEENKELIQKNKEHEELTYKLKVKLKKAHEKVTQLKSLQANSEELESANSALKQQLVLLEANQKHIQDENEVLQRQNQNDYEKIEADYQAQLEELVACKHELTVECEKLTETVKEMQGREEVLLSEITEYKQKMEENETGNQQRIQQLTEELEVAALKCEDSVKEIVSLNKQIEALEKELAIVKVAKETVECIVNEAEERVVTINTVGIQTDSLEDEKVNTESNVKEQVTEIVKPPVEDKPETVPTFHWPGNQQPSQSQDWFTAPPQHETQQQNQQTFNWFSDQTQSGSNNPPNPQADWFSRELALPQMNPFYAQAQPQQPAVVENTKEALLGKIKALEFLLFNIDKEKEEALQDCTGMVNELTQLVYEKVNVPTTEAVEAVRTESVNLPAEIESQILPPGDVVNAAANKKELQQIEFEKTDVALGEQSHPVVEDVVQPKRAYLTYQPEDKVSGGVKLEAFGENDDGWGWGPDEAKLEEEHLHQAESTPQIQNLRSQIAQLNERVQVLQVERENHLEEIKQLQVKSGKLIKKCKELKQKNDQMLAQQQNKKSEGADFFDLDETIQEELKAQIAQLEKKVKELTSELEREKHEKSNILKRVDVLTSANERMLEMKEIQDTEVLRWKRKHQELEEKLQQHEWGSDGFNEGVKSKSNTDSTGEDTKKIEELQQTIRELSLDNDELQALLDEQRQMRINAEKARNAPDATRTKEEYTKLAEELDAKIELLEQDLTGKREEMQAVLDEKNRISTQNAKLLEAISEKENNIAELQESLRNLSEKNSEFEVLLADKDKLTRDLLENEKNANVQQELSDKIIELENNLSQLKKSNVELEQLSLQKDADYASLKTAFDETNNLKEELNVQVVQLTVDLEQHRQIYDELKLENARNVFELEQQKLLYEQLQAESASKINEMEKYKQMYDKLQLENADQLSGSSKELEEQKLKCEQLQVENSKLASELNLLSQQLKDKQSESSERDDFELAQQKYQLESLLAEKEADINEVNSKKTELEEEVKLLKLNLEEKQTQYELLLNETEAKISKAAAALEENWAAEVDQRGADVAESWKLHLETVEADFASIQEKLKYEINELEEKCNGLVNENNELRKNVDAEIRNEVDRISSLQQQINDRQHYITELNNTLVEKQNENESLISKLTVLGNEKQQLKQEIIDKDTKLASLNIVVETTQKQFDEKREVVEEIVRILEKSTSWPLSYEKQDVLNEFQRQLNLVSEKGQEVLDLSQSVQALQSQINAVQEKDDEIFKLNQQIEDLQKQLDLVQGKDDEIFRLNKLVEDSQKQLAILHEKDAEILNLNNLIENLQLQLALVQEKDSEIFQLTKLVEDSQKQLSMLHEKDMEINNLNKLIEDLQRELALIQEKDDEIFRLNQLVQALQEQLGLLQEKDGEILGLNQVVEDYKMQQELHQQELTKAHQEQVNMSYIVEDYNKKLEEYQLTHIAIQNSLEEKNQLIATLNQQLQLQNDNKDVSGLQEEISQLKIDCSVLQQSLSECQQQLFKVTGELSNKNNELENVSQQLAYSQQNYEIQEAELNKLRDVLQARELEFSSSVENLRKTQLRDLESHYEEVIAAKNLDIESFKLQLDESIQNSQQLSERINLEVHLRLQLEENVQRLEEKFSEQAALLEEENRQLSEMRGIIEQQVIKIEELKKELFEKSNDYDSLIAEMDIGRKAITQQPTSSDSSTNVVETVSTVSQTQRPQEEDDLSEPVRRAELDLALYMLHQRDVRCEELTVELTQLLEERDTLQLRLSNAIREKEEIRRKVAGSEETPTTPSTPVTPLSKSSAIFLAASGTELATEPSETASGLENLENKLSQLKSVGYKKDKTFVDEQQLRRLQQMSIMQQHIQEASKLPPEAAAKLVDASYTLSRDVQSPSKVLLNWLWGRSTPKVNDT